MDAYVPVVGFWSRYAGLICPNVLESWLAVFKYLADIASLEILSKSKHLK